MSWQGWVALALYIAVVLAPLAFGSDYGVLVALLIATPLFVLVAYLKGEPPRWQWGEADDD